uniref:Uncharacterized protein n=1 Tax=Ditylenchus dipsaci TaxID=166011 RepID=A0A915DW04_9BILA
MNHFTMNLRSNISSNTKAVLHQSIRIRTRKSTNDHIVHTQSDSWTFEIVNDARDFLPNFWLEDETQSSLAWYYEVSGFVLIRIACRPMIMGFFQRHRRGIFLTTIGSRNT